MTQTKAMKDLKLPKTIQPETKEYMNLVVDKLTDEGLIEKCDIAALQMLAMNYNTFMMAQKQLSVDGLTVVSDRGNISEHPCVKIAKDAQTQAVKIMQEFGLTAKARTKVKGKSSDIDDSPFAQFVKKNK